MAGNYGIKISKDGFGVHSPPLTAGGYSWPPPSELVFSSGWFIFKIIATGTLTKSVPSSIGTTRIDTISASHSLGYAPAVMLYFSVDGGTKWYPSNAETENFVSTDTFRFVFAQATTTNITAEIVTGDLGAYTCRIRYIIFAEVNA